MNQQEALNAAKSSLATLQSFTAEQYPVGTVVKSRRGRGIAEFEVITYPEPTSLALAKSVIGCSNNGKEQTLNTESLLK